MLVGRVWGKRSIMSTCSELVTWRQTDKMPQLTRCNSNGTNPIIPAGQPDSPVKVQIPETIEPGEYLFVAGVPYLVGVSLIQSGSRSLVRHARETNEADTPQ